MNKIELHLVLVFTALLMLLAGRVRGDSLGRVTIDGATYEIRAAPEVTGPAATFSLNAQTYALSLIAPVARPSTAPASQPATQPATPVRPSPDNTGVAAGTSLKPAAGVVIKSGGTYEGLSFFGTQTIKLAEGQSVTFRNCRLDGNGGEFVVRCDRNLGTLILDHCEIINATAAAIYGDHFEATASYVHRIGGDGFKPGTAVLIQGNYVAELGWNAPAAHADGVQIRGGSDIRIVGNYFDLPLDVPNTKCNAVLFLQLAAKDVTFDGNWCRGGNFAVHAYSDNGNGPSVRITNNTFISQSTRYGFGSIGAGVVWSGNVNGAGKPATTKDR